MSKLKKLISWLAIGLLGITLAACGQQKNAPSKSSAVHVTNRQVRVVATDTIIGDITKNIAGKHAQIHVIVPTGQDPHEYDPLPADVRSTSKADVIFYNGVNLENAPNAWFTKLQKNIGPAASKKSHAVSDGIDVIYLQGKNETGKEDPHAWLNLANGIIYAKNIAIQLSAVDPQHKTDYQRNMKRYTAKLARLDAAAKTKFAKIPENKKLIVTSEGCFKYFSKAYNIPSAYIWEINTEEEGTPEQISSLVRKLRQVKPKSLFVESSVNAKPMQTVSKDTGIPIHSTLFTDSIAAKGKTGDSYYGMMKWNLDKIAEGLRVD
ncbi:metal ABC transporter substrate-binding protein [Schleiferilactobacillus harbinensis]|uniref:metal ABC transporter substrate-binding protein n=1 Tax=Schleiferilactobacillus harbinensis TaxID=304207 RepID=UPI0021A78171|nr:metal ABC transporter substrate-binding protein [Schleiferilactobacillus harbinensis]MCT2907612.1 metal ABC transporter substrate-binding protein [Schleiferilactobacillus harbinensis]